MSAGAFLAFEGIEGCGKSTQMDLLREHLEAGGCRVTTTREPGGTAIGDRIRALLLDPAAAEMHAETEMLLFAASRAQHVRQRIRPALEAGEVVLCDRFLTSSLAYQGVGRGLGVDQVRAANDPALDGLLPDRIVLLDLDPTAALARAKSRARLDRIEAETLAFHREVRRGFLAEAEREPQRFLLIDASGSQDDVHHRIRQGLAPLLEHQNGAA